jgi:hypothetical protein
VHLVPERVAPVGPRRGVAAEHHVDLGISSFFRVRTCPKWKSPMALVWVCLTNHVAMSVLRA